jgi:Holliday junction resolvasome RuvABC ATP-dependent DNA helicase subunit
MTTSLAAALAALEAVARSSGIDPAAARREGAALAAAIAESATGAADDWAAEMGSTTAGFFQAAVAARRFRAAPTDLLVQVSADGGDPTAYAQALTEVAASACDLGEPSMRVVSNASVAAAAQLRAAGIQPVPPVAAAGTTSSGPGAAHPVPVRSTSAPARPAPGTAAVVDEPEDTATLEEILAELDDLVGLDVVKGEVHHQAQVLRIAKLRDEAGIANPDITRHLVFVGNPGTGKTTVGRFLARIYRSLGLLDKGHLVETDRSGLVAGYEGQTALKVIEVVTTAIGGVLFIDEAYALVSGDFGQEAIDTLNKAMEDHRDDLVVVVAGYAEPMADFLDANPGLRSRFPKTIEFPDYTDDELVRIFESLCERSEYRCAAGTVDRVRTAIALAPRGTGFGNGRFVRNCFDAAVVAQAWRLRDVADPTVDQLCELLPGDVAVELPAPADPGTAGVVEPFATATESITEADGVAVEREVT